MHELRSQLVRHGALLRRLAKHGSIREGDVQSYLREATEVVAEALNIARVNVWLFAPDRSSIKCVEHYDLATGEHTTGSEILARDHPRYFQALEEERTIVANDARLDPRTKDFTSGYLDVHGITSMMDTPLHSGGDVVGIVCHEHIGPMRMWTPEEQQLAGSMADIASLALESFERQQVERALRGSELRLRAILDQALDAILSVDEQGVIIDWNPQAEAVFGWSSEEAIGRTLFETVVRECDRDALERIGRGLVENGDSEFLGRRIHATAKDRGGREFPIELSAVALDVGEHRTFSVFARDITARVESQERQELLMHELDHRVKNNLSWALSLAALTGAESNDVPEFLESFEGRIRGLARLHETLALGSWGDTDLLTVARLALNAHLEAGTGRAKCTGPEVLLPLRLASPVCMAIHELTTNAMKHGALSTPDGVVELTWEVDDGDHVSMKWVETGGPTNGRPGDPSTGLKLIEGLVDYELSGKHGYEFTPTGFECWIRFPITS
tara:strand:+ start:38934 stop:40442 length:1509 start_codon:yes stop_codon:yes gene_type:complete